MITPLRYSLVVDRVTGDVIVKAIKVAASEVAYFSPKVQSRIVVDKAGGSAGIEQATEHMRSEMLAAEEAGFRHLRTERDW